MLTCQHGMQCLCIDIPVISILQDQPIILQMKPAKATAALAANPGQPQRTQYILKHFTEIVRQSGDNIQTYTRLKNISLDKIRQGLFTTAIHLCCNKLIAQLHHGSRLILHSCP